MQNITNALATIAQLQGKTFVLNGNPDRQMGFIAQEVQEVVPEVVFVDETTDDNWHFLQYDRMVALLCKGVKELSSKVTSLEARVTALGG